MTERHSKMSIRWKIFLVTAVLTTFAICLVTVFSMMTIYDRMQAQVIETRDMSIGWLKDRLDLSIKELTDRFYGFEADAAFRNDLQTWCSTESLDYSARLRYIASFNHLISIDPNINSIDLYNLVTGQVLTAARSGASFGTTEGRLSHWEQREDALQTNVVFFREGKEILVCHQINRFEDNSALALIVIHLRPYELEGILADLKASAKETIIVFNDAGERILADMGAVDPPTESECRVMGSRLSGTISRFTLSDARYWFYRTSGSGKLKIVLAEPDDVILSAMTQTLFVGLLIALLSILGLVAVSALFSSIIARPIRQLTEKMSKSKFEEYSAEGVSGRFDEIGMLQDSFDEMMTRNRELVSQEYQNTIEKRTAQIRALQAQINPHFMYNTLQVIGGMALRKEAPEIYGVTLALGDILRYSLNFSKEMVPLREEISNIQSYLQIQDERFANRIRLQIDIPADLLECRIPKLILQPLLENSIEHGFMEKPGEWGIRITAKVEEGDLLISVEDNGVGIPREEQDRIHDELVRGTEKAIGSGSHIGLNNVNARIRLRNGEEGYGVVVTSELGNGTTVSIRTKCVKEDADA
jgi:two-component system sensor histidine kinase YesM